MKGDDTPTTGTPVYYGNWTSSDISKSMSGKGQGTFTLWINSTKYNDCSISIAPSVTCPSKRTYSVDSDVEFKVASLSNCGGGCDYLLQPSSGTAYASVLDGTGTYESANTGISFHTPIGEADNVAYTFTVYDKSNHDVWDSCQGLMKFVSGSTCTDKGTWTITSNNGNAPSLNWAKASCFTITATRVCTSMQFKSPECKGKTIKFNNADISLGSGDGYFSGSIPAAARSKNIKLDMPDECSVTQFYVDGCFDPKPVISCSALNDDKNINSSVQITPTVTSCTNDIKCSYTIVGGATDINHSEKNWTSTSAMDELAVVSSEGSVTYTLQVSNAFETSSACVFTINYIDPNKPIEVTNNTGFNVSASGTKIKIKGGSASGGCQIGCNPKAGNVGTFSVTIGTTSYSGNNYAGGSINTSLCQAGAESTVTTSHDATCTIGWW